MKKLATAIAAIALIGTPAFAADMAVKAPPPLPAPVYSWTGFYVGANGGYGWKDSTVTFAPNDFAVFAYTCGGIGGSTCPPPASFNNNGGLGGLQAGYNWQVSQQWLLGLETDFDLSGIRGAGTSNFLMNPLGNGPGTSNFQASEDITWFGTVRGRLGFLPASNVLIYATGGLAYGRLGESVSLNNIGGLGVGVPGFSFQCGTIPAGTPNCFVGGSSRTTAGWAAGGGLEYLLWRNVSLKAEYLFIGLKSNAVDVVAQTTLIPGTNPSSFTAAYGRADFNIVRVGLNYQFH